MLSPSKNYTNFFLHMNDFFCFSTNCLRQLIQWLSLPPVGDEEGRIEAETDPLIIPLHRAQGEMVLISHSPLSLVEDPLQLLLAQEALFSLILAEDVGFYLYQPQQISPCVRFVRKGVMKPLIVGIGLTMRHIPLHLKRTSTLSPPHRMKDGFLISGCHIMSPPT
jgi:hypothetical protein